MAIDAKQYMLYDIFCDSLMEMRDSILQLWMQWEVSSSSPHERAEHVFGCSTRAPSEMGALIHGESVLWW